MDLLVGLADKLDAELEKLNDKFAEEHEKLKNEDELNRLAFSVGQLGYLPIAKTKLKLHGMGLQRASYTVLSFIVEEAYIDVLRLGEGYKKYKKDGTKMGLVEDAVRGLVIVGAALKGLAKAGKFAVNTIGLRASVDFSKGALENCGWVAGARGARLSGHSLFAKVTDLAKVLKLDPQRLIGSSAALLQVALREMKIESRLVQLKEVFRADWANKTVGKSSYSYFATMQHLEAEVRAAKGELFWMSLNWAEDGGKVLDKAHAVLMRWGPKGLEIVDRTGKTYRSLAEMEGAGYRGISKAVVEYELLRIPNARLVKALDAADAAAGAGVMAMVAVEVMLAWIDQVRGVPPSLARAENAGPFVAGGTTAIPPKPPLSALRYYVYTVQTGDTTATIAQRVYNDRAKVQPIRESNDELPADANAPLAPLAGMELFIPSAL